MNLSHLLKEQMSVSRGCTEVGAISLATSLAYNSIRGYIPNWVFEKAKEKSALKLPCVDKIEITLDRNVYKNAFSVGIPNTNGGSGIELMAALGIYCEPEKKLELLGEINPEILARAKEIASSGVVSVNVRDNWTGKSNLDVNVKIKSGKSEGACRIYGSHTNVVYVGNNHGTIYNREIEQKEESHSSAEKIMKLKFSDLIEFVKEMGREDRDFILDGINRNDAAAKIGLENQVGLGIGRNMQKLIDAGKLGGYAAYAQMLTAAASDARMGGWNVPVSTSAGSGNQGIVVTNPIHAVHKLVKGDKDRLIESVALAHLVTIYSSAFSGYLSALCGCTVKAGIGASAGMAYYFTKDAEIVSESVKHTAANIPGVICDGAKPGCSEKLCTAANTAVCSALLAESGVTVPCSNGIVAKTAEETIRNIGTISQGMISLDKVIVEIMEEKQSL